MSSAGFNKFTAVVLVADTSSSTSTLKEDESFLRRDTFANRSFGLCSPDKSSLAERMHPSYNPRLFVDGGLYLDPDIIGTLNAIYLGMMLKISFLSKCCHNLTLS